ncbi:MAG: LlaJI family restriction endonuclease [Clostridia bacterium]|nr:LlaJI family restriction endonuclease [Clostridia bacterium]
MLNFKEICSVSASEKDNFVGLRFEKESSAGQPKPKIIFPKGWSEERIRTVDEEQLRKDIILLFSAIKRFGSKEQGNLSGSLDGERDVDFPILSYQYIIHDFLCNGYYVEREVQYTDGLRGKINWKRTIQKKKPVVSGGNVVYLDFIVKSNQIKENNLITLIHQYCVKESFDNLGWLYVSGDFSLPTPAIQFCKPLFVSTLREALNNTFNENKRRLFTCMLNIVEGKEKDGTSSQTAFGLKKFEVVWEGMIQAVFGKENTSDYFPHANWYIVKDSQSYRNTSLRPDTIMEHDDKLYILDAKYYRYGIDENNPDLLPHTADIAKQIVYGKYIQDKKRHKNGTEYENDQIYNAFIMPFASDDPQKQPYKFVSIGTAEWEKYTASSPAYCYVLGILLDTRYLMEQHFSRNEIEVQKLSELIEDSLKNNRIHIDTTSTP